MTHDEVVTWDATSYQPPAPETWVQQRTMNVKVMGGLPNVIVATSDGEYRHTPDGRLWKLPCTS